MTNSVCGRIEFQKSADYSNEEGLLIGKPMELGELAGFELFIIF
jgi:hypothetical protein